MAKLLTNEILFAGLKDEDFIYPLELDSDIAEIRLNEHFRLKRITDDDWLHWFGMKVTRVDDGQGQTLESLGGGTLSSSPLLTSGGPTWISIFDNNYVITGKGWKQRGWIRDFDKAIRLFSTGRSGIHFGLSKSMHQPVHPSPGWKKLSPTRLQERDVSQLLRLMEGLSGDLNGKCSLLIDRFRHATQGAHEIGLHNRLLDLVTILEILFVPDGKSGQISYKLRARGARFLSKVMDAEAKEIWKTLKNLYDLRSKAAHGENLAEISVKTWWELTNIARLGILGYLDDPKRFEPNALDMELIS